MTVPAAIRPLGSHDKYINCLIVAGPGFGKTVFFGSDDNVLFITTDPEGTISAWSLGSQAREWPVKSWEDIDAAYKYLRDGGIKELGLDNGGWVVLDNVSEAQEFGKQANILMEHARNKNIDLFVPSQANYQRTQNMLIQMVKAFNDLPVNMGYTAWIARLEDSDGIEYFAPAIHGQQGAIAQMIAGYMNVVGYGEVQEDEHGVEHRILHFAQNGPYRGKDRYIALGKKRTDLTLPKMQSIIKAAIAKREAAVKTPTRSASGTTKSAPVRRRAVARKA